MPRAIRSRGLAEAAGAAGRRLRGLRGRQHVAENGGGGARAGGGAAARPSCTACGRRAERRARRPRRRRRRAPRLAVVGRRRRSVVLHDVQWCQRRHCSRLCRFTPRQHTRARAVLVACGDHVRCAELATHALNNMAEIASTHRWRACAGPCEAAAEWPSTAGARVDRAVETPAQRRGGARRTVARHAARTRVLTRRRGGASSEVLAVGAGIAAPSRATAVQRMHDACARPRPHRRPRGARAPHIASRPPPVLEAVPRARSPRADRLGPPCRRRRRWRRRARAALAYGAAITGFVGSSSRRRSSTSTSASPSPPPRRLRRVAPRRGPSVGHGHDARERLARALRRRRLVAPAAPRLERCTGARAAISRGRARRR